MTSQLEGGRGAAAIPTTAYGMAREHMCEEKDDGSDKEGDRDKLKWKAKCRQRNGLGLKR